MELIKVRKANTILSVTVDEKASYLAKGYDVLGENGKVVEESIPYDTATLQAKYLELKQENGKLKAEIASLKAAKKVETKEEKPATKIVETVVEELPKTTRTRSRK